MSNNSVPVAAAEEVVVKKTAAGRKRKPVVDVPVPQPLVEKSSESGVQEVPLGSAQKVEPSKEVAAAAPKRGRAPKKVKTEVVNAEVVVGAVAETAVAPKQKKAKKQSAQSEATSTEAQGEPAVAKGRRKRVRRPRDPTKPRKLSSFMVYSNALRAGIRAQNPALKTTEIGSLLGKMWKALSDEEKKKYPSILLPPVELGSAAKAAAPTPAEPAGVSVSA